MYARLPIMLYGLDVCCLCKAEVNSLDFVINRFCMKLFRTNNMNAIKDCQTYFNLNLLSELLVKRYFCRNCLQLIIYTGYCRFLA